MTLVMLNGCSDSDDCQCEIDDSRLPLLEEGQPDITGGYNVLIINAADVYEFKHKLGTRKNIRLIADDNLPYKFTIYTEADTSRYLMVESVVDNDIAVRGPKVLNLRLETSDGDLRKDLRIVVRDVASPTSVSEYAYNIGKGTNIFADLGNVTYPVLDFNTIAPQLSDNVNNVQQAIHFEIGGERYDETMSKMSVSVGLDGTSPTINTKHKFFFSAGATFGQESMDHRIKNYEYYLGFYGKVMSEVKLNPDWLLPYEEDGTLYTLLDPTINDALNNPGSPIYKNYPDTEEGMFALFDHYGTHVISKAAFGGTYIWMYGRKENAYEHSIGHDASAHVMFKGTNGEPATTWVEVYQKKHSSPYISANGVGSDYDYDYEEASASFERSMITGGDANTDIETWEQNFSTEKPDKWVIVSYKTLDDGDARLIPLYEFVQDKSSDRYKMMTECWEKYEESKYVELYEDELVLADFYMKKSGSQSHEKGEPESFVGTGPDGKKYVYFPMMANGNFLYGDQRGYAVETNQDKFVEGDTKRCHYWYYALGYDSECNGITDILFDNKDHSGFTRRGNHANDGVSGLIDNNYTYIKTGTSSTPTSDKIKAVGLYKHDKDVKYKPSLLMATSGGAEMKLPFENSENIGNFESYWGATSESGHVSEVSGSNDFYIGGLVTKNDIRVFYQKTSLPIGSLSFGEGKTSGKIQHPKKWGE